MARPIACALAFLVLVVVATGAHAQTAGDPAARGLDVFLHLSDSVASGGVLAVQAEAMGFPGPGKLVALPGAVIEAAWDPESLGPGVTAVPAPVKVTADADGRAHLDVPVPKGPQRELRLVIGVRSGAHARTRSVPVARVGLYRVGLHVVDESVVPGSAITTWVLVESAVSGMPVASQAVELSLLEGGLARSTQRLKTDAAGSATARVAIPWTEEPSWSWTLRARTVSSDGEDAGSVDVQLRPREETPATPSMTLSWDQDHAAPGDHATYRIAVRDAADEPVAGSAVRVWVGPKGTEAPTDDDAWEKASSALVTDPSGQARGGADAPSVVVKGAGTTLTVLARARVEGHELKSRAVLAVDAAASQAELLPEAGEIVPGIEQRMLVRLRDGKGHPVATPLAIEADGLAAQVTTNPDGEAEVSWRAPDDLGALRNVGPCAGSVAATVILRPTNTAALGRQDPFELCVSVDRDVTAIVRPEASVVRAGDRVRFRIVSARGRSKAAPGAAPREGAWSVIASSDHHAQAISAWIADGERGGELPIPAGASAWSRVTDDGRQGARRWWRVPRAAAHVADAHRAGGGWSRRTRRRG